MEMTIGSTTIDRVWEQSVYSAAKSFGTPTFLFNRSKLMEALEGFQQVWSSSFPNNRIYYSYKTNYLPDVCLTAHRAGWGADVVSGYELDHALKLCPSGPLVFNGPMKTRDELTRAVKAGALINIDCDEEVSLLLDILGPRAEGFRVGLRVNPAHPVYVGEDPSFDHSHAAAVTRSKFGWPVPSGDAKAMAARIRDSGLSIGAIHCQLGSQITDEDLFLGALERVVAFAKELRCAGDPVDEINIGGGFGTPGLLRHHRGWLSSAWEQMGGSPPVTPKSALDMESFTSRLSALIRDYGMESVTVACEPGRRVISEALSIVTSVVSVKHFQDKSWVIVDAGLHLLPTIAMGEQRRIDIIPGDGRTTSNNGRVYAVGGPLCYEGDVISSAETLPDDIRAGDLLLIHDAGAYTVSRSTNFIRPRAAVVEMEDAGPKLIWARETYADIFGFARS